MQDNNAPDFINSDRLKNTGSIAASEHTFSNVAILFFSS
jgi:hypothetical protein